MKNIMQPISVLACLLALSGCTPPSPQAYANFGDPERQIIVSTEIVPVELSSDTSLDELATMLAQELPERATLNCQQDDKLCRKAAALFKEYGVSASYEDDSESVNLLYERIMARDCENRYIDNSSNNYNLQSTTIGCSVRSNMLQQVTDKRQFTRPVLQNLPDGEKAAQAYDHYLNPPAASSSEGSGASGSSLIGSSSSSSSQ